MKKIITAIILLLVVAIATPVKAFEKSLLDVIMEKISNNVSKGLAENDAVDENLGLSMSNPKIVGMMQWDSTTNKWTSNEDILLGGPSASNPSLVGVMAWDNTNNKWTAWDGSGGGGGGGNIASGTVAGQFTYWDGNSWEPTNATQLSWSNTGELRVGAVADQGAYSLQVTDNAIIDTLTLINDLDVIHGGTGTGTPPLAGSMLIWDGSAYGFIASSTLGGGGTGSGTVNSGTQGQVAYYASNGTAVSGTSTIFIENQNVGIGTDSPSQKLDVSGNLKVSSITDTTNLTISGITGSTQCLQANASGVVSGTGSACGAGGGGTSDNFIENITPTGLVNGTNKVFILPSNPTGSSLQFTINGILQTNSTDYALSGDTITIDSSVLAPETGSILRAFYRTTSNGNFADNETPSGLVNGSNKEYVWGNTPASGSLKFTINGVLQVANDDYTIAGATTTLTTAPETGSILRGFYRY